MTLAITVDAAPSFIGNYHRPARIGYVAIALTFGGLGLWATLAPLDSATIAAGQVAIESDHKPIQHLEGGIVSAILVSETEHVAAGQVLFRLEPVQALATQDSLQKQLDDSHAQEARLVAERDCATDLVLPAELIARQQRPDTAATIADQKRQFAEDRRITDNDIKLQGTRIDQANLDIEGKQKQANLLKQQLDSYNSEYDGLAQLTRKGYYPRAKLNAFDRERLSIAGQIQGIMTDVDRSRGVIDEANLQIRQIHQHGVEEASSKLVDIRSRIADLVEKLKVASDVVGRQDVRAPRAGIVQNIKVHTIGAVVRPGDSLAELVTVADRLIMTAKVSPADIQNIQAGQRTEVRFPTLAHEQKQPAYGRLDSISADLVTDDVTHQPFYEARVILDPATLDPPVATRLVPGMPADLLIINGERTALAYLIQPVLSRVAKTMREK